MAFTDGVSEALNDADEEFGENRLAELIDACADRGAADICSTILEAIRQHRGRRQDQDDVTAMVVRTL